jgi:hypothetical protein
MLIDEIWGAEDMRRFSVADLQFEVLTVLRIGDDAV